MLSWFKRIWTAARGKVNEAGQDFIVQRLEKPQGVADAPRVLAKEEEYVAVTVRSSRIVNTRKWTGKFYGAVNARGHYYHEDKGLVEYQTVLAPSLMKELDPAHLERVITINKGILGPVPYLGKLGLELGLFSVKGSDLAGPYIDVLTSLAETAGVGAFTTALPLVAPLRKGLDLLFGNTNQAELEIGLDEEWNDVTTGTWLVIRAPKGDPSVKDLRVDPNDFGLVGADGKAYRDAPYIVFAIEGMNRRDDWMIIAELKHAWDAIGTAAKAGKQNEAEVLFKQFELTTKWSPDLIPADAARLVKKARARLPQLQPERAIAAGPKTKGHPLGEFETLDLYG
jgi:hypothetical protein